jgi:flavodoxin
MSTVQVPPKRGIVLFNSRYGNTEKIAESLSSGLREAGVEVLCASATDFSDLGNLAQYDLICIGAPTEMFTAYKPTKNFLDRLRESKINLAGKRVFAFDTKLDSRLSGSAAKYIEKELGKLGAIMIAPKESAIVFSTKKQEAPGGVILKPGEEERFHEIGLRMGANLLTVKTIIA